MFLNQCNFIGRLGADPEQRFTQSGKAVANFRIAVSEKRGGEEHTEWVSVVCWEKTAEFVSNYMKKGQLCFVSGRMQTRSWDDSNGVKKYTTEIVASIVQNLSPRSDSGSTREEPPSGGGYGGAMGTGDDVPFAPSF